MKKKVYKHEKIDKSKCKWRWDSSINVYVSECGQIMKEYYIDSMPNVCPKCKKTTY